MESIPPSEQPDIARDVAFELRRPWRVEHLRAKAREGYEADGPPSAILGPPGGERQKRMRSWLREYVRKAGKRMDRLPPRQGEPSPGQIETALEAFTVEQWGALIESFDKADAEVLLAFIRQDTDGLKRRIGARRVERIEARAIMRGTELWLEANRSKLVPISDPYWANFWPGLASQADLEGMGHPAKGVSVKEQTSDRSIARRLTKRDEMKVTPHQVKTWRERTEKLPFEQYVADVGADDEEKRAAAWIAWLTMIRKKHQRKN